MSLCLLLPLDMMAEDMYRFRVYLKDKGNSGYTVDRPSEFLSDEAIARRDKFGIPVTEQDLPIAEDYFKMLEENGGIPVCSSRWQSTIVVECKDSSAVSRLLSLPMVKSVDWIWKGNLSAPEREIPEEKLLPDKLPLDNYYGFSEEQIKMLNGIKLHHAGFDGEGMTVAVIDAGFENVDKIAVFDSLRLKGTYNVHFPGQTVYADDDHGTKVLSCMAANTPGVMVGTAPKASYWLIESEDSSSEYPIEEDYWTAAVEYADSVGVDVITSSLGYFKYDAPELSYKKEDLDGVVSFISRTATLAAEKGILMFCSAGNEGGGRWGKITFPGDADKIVTVGAITKDKKRSNFSSVGPSADLRVKPDLVALGTDCQVISPDGELSEANGTSFSTPILAGLGACLWQALPSLDNQTIIKLLRESGSQYKKPDKEFGYGIPNVYKAYKRGLKYVPKSKRK